MTWCHGFEVIQSIKSTSYIQGEYFKAKKKREVRKTIFVVAYSSLVARATQELVRRQRRVLQHQVLISGLNLLQDNCDGLDPCVTWSGDQRCCNRLDLYWDLVPRAPALPLCTQQVATATLLPSSGIQKVLATLYSMYIKAPLVLRLSSLFSVSFL